MMLLPISVTDRAIIMNDATTETECRVVGDGDMAQGRVAFVEQAATVAAGRLVAAEGDVFHRQNTGRPIPDRAALEALVVLESASW